MQEEVNEKTISLCIKGGKITAQILKAALIKLLAEMDKKKQRGKGEKSQCKKTGKQSIKSLQKSGAQITNIVVTDNNIKSFDRVARKYGIDYSLKKVEQNGKTEYVVFFKAKDVDVMIRFPRIHAAICQTIIRLPGAFLPPENHPRRASEHRIVRKQEHRRYIVNTCLIDGDLAAPVQSRLQCRAVFLRRIVYRKSVYHFSSVVLWDCP